jgi:hypothetical protein
MEKEAENQKEEEDEKYSIHPGTRKLTILRALPICTGEL